MKKAIAMLSAMLITLPLIAFDITFPESMQGIWMDKDSYVPDVVEITADEIYMNGRPILRILEEGLERQGIATSDTVIREYPDAVTLTFPTEGNSEIPSYMIFGVSGDDELVIWGDMMGIGTETMETYPRL